MEKIIPILSKQINVHHDTLYRIRRGERKPTVNLALKLEKTTGINAEIWLFPERYFNPWEKVSTKNGQIIKIPKSNIKLFLL